VAIHGADGIVKIVHGIEPVFPALEKRLTAIVALADFPFGLVKAFSIVGNHLFGQGEFGHATGLAGGQPLEATVGAAHELDLVFPVEEFPPLKVSIIAALLALGENLVAILDAFQYVVLGTIPVNQLQVAFSGTAEMAFIYRGPVAPLFRAGPRA
jgi:hypothetical protein